MRKDQDNKDKNQEILQVGLKDGDNMDMGYTLNR